MRTTDSPPLGAVAQIAPQLAIVGPVQHGVSLYAAQLAGAVAELSGLNVSVETMTGADLESGTAPVHLQFTDRLFGRSPGEAAERIESIAARRPVTLTLHDLPQPSDGRVNLPIRSAAYRRIIDVATGIVCNSNHEASLLFEFSAPDNPVVPQVIPLPVMPVAGEIDPVGVSLNTVAVLGYVYPGKGHLEIIDAVAQARGLDSGLTGNVSVLALGGSAPGHEGDIQALVEMARSHHIDFSVSGFLSETKLADYCRRIAVPVAAHQHVSASGSVNSWIGHGRRPLVPNSRYFAEMSQLRPGCLNLVDPGELASSINRALADPSSTWLAADTSTGPGLKEVAEQYLSWWSAVLR